MKQTNLLKTFLLLCALIVGSTCAWADSYTITFKETGTDSDNSTKRTSIEDIISDGASYVSSITDVSNVYNARTGRGIKLGTSKASGALTLNLKETVKPTKITFKARQYGASEKSITVNGQDETDLTTSFDEYTIDYDGATEVSSIAISTPSKRAYITEVTIHTGAAPDPVAVTSVSVDPTSWEMVVGDTKTLTATVLPSNASDKSVTWESDDESVATVSDAGVVTAVAAGTATITVTTTDGSKTATCEITVNPAPAVAATLDFTDTAWGFPNDYTKTEGTNTNGGYTIVVGATAADGHKALKLTVGEVTTQVGLIFGKNGAQVTLPTFDFNVNKIKVYGRSGAATGVKFNIFVGDEAVSTEATGSHVDHEFEIAADKQTAGTEYVLKLTTTDKNCQISKIEIFGYESTPAVSAAGWATYVTKNPVRFTEGEAFAVTSVGTSVGLTAVTDVPKGEPVLLKGAGAKTAEVLESAAAIENKLAISDGSNGVNDYVLANHGGKVGFYKWTGSALASGKVYLPASEVAGARDFIGFDETTGIANINSDAKTLFNGDFYNLAGQRVAQPTKGLYIVNGKKVVIK